MTIVVNELGNASLEADVLDGVGVGVLLGDGGGGVLEIVLSEDEED